MRTSRILQLLTMYPDVPDRKVVFTLMLCSVFPAISCVLQMYIVWFSVFFFYYYEIFVIVLYKLEIAHAASFCLRSDGLNWAGFTSLGFCSFCGL